MSETQNNTKEVKSQTSIWAKASICSALIGSILILSPILFHILHFNIIAPEILSGFRIVGFILTIFGFIFGITSLIYIKSSKTKLKEAGFAISGIIISLIPFALYGYAFYYFYTVVMREKPYDDSNPKAVIAKIEKFRNFHFPEKIKSLKTAEKITAGIDPAYTCIIRFTTDWDGFTKLRNSLSKIEGYSEEITSKLVDEEGNSYTYGSRPNIFIAVSWKKNAPDWFNTEIPKGRVYELCLWPEHKGVLISFLCVELPDSNDVVVNMEGWTTNIELIHQLIKPEQ